MRLWHFQLIPYLPKNQLISQWRECCCIAKNIAINGTPNHILVNKVLNYNQIHFEVYTQLVIKEMKKRGYEISKTAYENFYKNLELSKSYFKQNKLCMVDKDKLFPFWHTPRYLQQNLFNLEEKFDCGGITNYEWQIIVNRFW